jgi:hypothetical protein
MVTSGAVLLVIAFLAVVIGITLVMTATTANR